MEIVKENKIKQLVKIEIEYASKEYREFVGLITAFIEKNGHKIEGTVEAVSVDSSWSKDLTVKVSAVQEDKLKLLADKTMDVN